MEYNEIISLMQEMTNMGLTRIMIEQDNFKLELEKNNNVSTAPTQATTVLPVAENIKSREPIAEAPADREILGTKRILSPMVGTFYAQPTPEKPAFISVGDTVKKGQPVCIIEAMKLMNEIESEVEGEIIEFLVENEEMVEFGQPLFLVK